MKTESEAKRTICPFTSILAALLRSSEWIGCHGSGCMMWRWERDEDGREKNCGYCGTAGKP